MTPCKFTFDDGPQWDGFAHGSTWNGFDNVAVTHAERKRIADWMIASAFDKDAVREEVQDLLAITPIDGTMLFSLGWGYATHIVRDPSPLPACAAHIIAIRLATVLAAWLTPEEWVEMRKRNAVQTDSAICHSHDFCDANMAMCEAFESVTGRTPDVDDEAISKLWNDAWDIAMPLLGRK
jgi:hypothetical protein